MSLFSKPQPISQPIPQPIIQPTDYIDNKIFRLRLEIQDQKEIIKQEVLESLKQAKVDTFDWEKEVFFAEIERELSELNDYCNNSFNELQKMIEEKSSHPAIPIFVTEKLEKLERGIHFVFGEQQDMKKPFVKWFGKLLASGLKGEEYKEASRDYQQLKEV